MARLVQEAYTLGMLGINFPWIFCLQKHVGDSLLTCEARVPFVDIVSTSSR